MDTYYVVEVRFVVPTALGHFSDITSTLEGNISVFLDQIRNMKKMHRESEKIYKR